MVAVLTDIEKGITMARRRTKSNGRTKRVAWTAADVRELKMHSRKKTPVVKISRAMKRTEGALRQKALALDISIGHRR
jgi:hypothetical protein